MMMRKTKNGLLIEIHVKTNARRFRVYEKGDRLIVEVVSPPREGKANAEIIKELKKLFRRDVKVVRGFGQNRKLVLIRDANEKSVQGIMSILK